MKLSEKIKEYRRIFHLSQEQLAEKLNVSRQVITKWENENGMPEISNLQAIADLFDVSIDFLLNDGKTIEFPVIKEKYTLDKNNYSSRYDYAASLLKDRYANIGSIYSLTETKEKTKLTELFSFFTFGISDISYITQWLSEMAIWFIVETNKQKLLIKVTKEFIETRELSSLVDTDKFTYEKSNFMKVSEL